MYHKNLAVALKVNGKVVRDDKETAYLPFGSEYSIYIKNLNSLRALVRIQVDGTDATENTSIIVPANDSVEIERFVKAGSFDKGLRFKFIERTSKIENGPRGVKAEDGLIRVEFEFEREPAPIKYYVPPQPVYWPPVREIHHHQDPWNTKLGGSTCDSAQYSDTLARGTADYGDAIASASLGDVSNGVIFSSASNGTITANATNFGGCASANAFSASTKSAVARSKSMGASDGVLRSKRLVASQATEPQNDVGITVGGSVSDQKFVTGSWFATDGVKHVMVLKILGEVGEQRVQKPVLVNTKQECPTCGTKNKFGTKFCKECGTGLSIV